MNLTKAVFFVIASHSSISAFLITVLIVFGSVFLTLIYVGWRKYHLNNNDDTKNIDEEQIDD